MYRDRPHPCVPLLLRLGNAIGYPNIQGLLDDVTNGFPLLGPITPGECWDDKGVWSPAHVLDKSDFLHANAAHVREGTQTRKPDKHWEDMLDTLISERGQGKIVGPFAAPPNWYVRTVPVDASRMTLEDHRQPLLDPPTDLMAASFAFAIMVVGHYVDDFTGIENAHTAMSAFESFEEFNEILGATMKRAKRAPHVRAPPLLGVILELGPDMVSVSPTPNRRHKLRSLCQKYLVPNTLSPTDAGSLAGKATFFNTSCTGRVGSAAVSPVYARHHAGHHVTTLTDSLRAALVTIARIATNALPRTLPLSTDWRPVPLVYADAFFNLG